ncbi:MAG: hypothetical protein KDK70_20280, partial [Myxococcales bacterium]|nr:hypothetical protein [Myxococcales bacterium]
AWLGERLEPEQARAVEASQREAMAQLPARARAAQSTMPAALGGIEGEPAERLAAGFVAHLVAA